MLNNRIVGAWALFEEFRFEGLIVSEVNPEFQGPHELRMDMLLFEAWRGRSASLPVPARVG